MNSPQFSPQIQDILRRMQAYNVSIEQLNDCFKAQTDYKDYLDNQVKAIREEQEKETQRMIDEALATEKAKADEIASKYEAEQAKIQLEIETENARLEANRLFEEKTARLEAEKLELARKEAEELAIIEAEEKAKADLEQTTITDETEQTTTTKKR
jgi:hypothetical protein